MIATGVTFLASFFKTFWLFCAVYAFGFGVGDGISYMSPLIMGWSYFPQHKGRISGGFLTFFALGTTIFSLVSTAIINPDNKKTDIKVKSGDTTDKYYSAEIADGFPAMMRWLSLCYFCISMLGVCLIIPLNTSSEGHQVPNDNIRLPSVKAGLKHPKFRLMFIMGLLSSSTV
jgi:MFS family permease